MPNAHGDFIWYELMTPDARGAEGFYGGLIGWSFDTPQVTSAEGDSNADHEYRVFRKGGPEAGGLMPLTETMLQGGAKAMWAGYIGVDDVDAAAVRIRSHGGTVPMPPRDIPGVGRFAYVHDPQGAPFYIMRGASDEPSHAFAQEAPREGHCAWNELNTSDREGAEAFYEAVFGWEKAASMDMGELEPYDMFRNPPHANMLGAIAQLSDGMPASMWSFYFRVRDIDAAAEYTAGHGGQVVHGPMEIPGGEYVFTGQDPQGAMFSIIGPRNK